MPSIRPASADAIDHATAYLALGWKLCRIVRGTKGPNDTEWAGPRMLIDSAEKAAAMIGPQHGIGLVHGPSGTCAIDVDHLEYFDAILAEFGFDRATLFAGAPQISGRPGRAKAIFRLPEGVTFSRRALAWPKQTDAGKPTTVFELRSGEVQDVLPPTIHPDMQAPYTWTVAPWDLPSIPILPAPLVALWRDWDKLKPQLVRACPWAPAETAAALPIRQTPRRESRVIEAFNTAHDLRALLEHHGYQPKGKRRFLAPTSSTGLAGVIVLDDGHVYSHHASDLLCDGHAHDAFDVYRMLVHGGDFRIAVREGAKLLDIRQEPEPIAPGVANIVANQARPKREPAAEPVREVGAPPDHLLAMPGALGDFVRWTNATAPKPQPLFATGAALALGSVALARRWTTQLGTYSNLFILHVGKSASGKEHARTAIERVLTSAALTRLIGPSGYTSDGAIFSALLAQPSHVAIVDELGELLRNAQAEGNYAKRQALTLLMEVWGRAGGTLRPQGYSTMTLSADQAKEFRERTIERPGLSLLGMTTPDSFYESLDEHAIRGGFLNRLLPLETHIGRQEFNAELITAAVPEHAVAWLQAVREPVGGNLEQIDAAGVAPGARTVPIEAAAMAAWRAYSADCLRAMNTLDDEGLAEIEGRSAEKAMRVALILAVSDSCEAPLIRASHVDWARDLVRFSTAQVLDAARRRLHASRFGKDVEEVARLIESAGAGGRTQRELAKSSRQWRGLTPQQQDNVIESLIRSGRARWHETKGARGRPRKALIADGIDADDD
jgi:hypothetical protein